VRLCNTQTNEGSGTKDRRREGEKERRREGEKERRKGKWCVSMKAV
jgi:hypothetical protein